MDTDGSVTRLIEELRSADPRVNAAPARLIWERYLGALLALAKDQLARRVRCREDEEDVLQSTFKSFFRRRDGDFDLTDRNDPWRLLVTITLRKTRNVANRHEMKQRDVWREHSAQWGEVDPSRGELLDLIDSEPTADDAAALVEGFQQRIETLTDPSLRQVALLKMKGHTNAEIAELQGCVERTVGRKLERIRDRWTECDTEAI
jgi:RNA polymerase sigma-70 factor (ECF subfamily)